MTACRREFCVASKPFEYTESASMGVAVGNQTDALLANGPMFGPMVAIASEVDFESCGDAGGAPRWVNPVPNNCLGMPFSLPGLQRSPSQQHSPLS